MSSNDEYFDDATDEHGGYYDADEAYDADDEYGEGQDYLPCPECGVDIFADAVQCPQCGWYVSWDDVGGRTPRGQWWVKTGIAILASGALLYVVLSFF